MSRRRIKKMLLAEALRVYREGRPHFEVVRFSLAMDKNGVYSEYCNPRFRGQMDWFANLMELCRKLEAIQ